MDIARRFTGQPNGAVELTGAIRNGVSGQWAGYPPMPGELATPKQAKNLAELILHLAR
jgi:cytochrome c551/c552